MTLGDVKKMMGTIIDEDVVVKMPKNETIKYRELLGIQQSKSFDYDYDYDFESELPESFEPVDKWPACKNIYHARDQSNCGSCWAHGTTEALEDRLCISGSFSNLLSVADTTGCCGFLNCMSMGCDGGQIGTPWDWFKTKGVVTGGD